MPVDRERSVASEGLSASGHFDLVMNGIDRWGQPATLGWSEITGEIYASVIGTPRDVSLLVEVYGRVDTVAQARKVQALRPRDASGATLIDAARGHLQWD